MTESLPVPTFPTDDEGFRKISELAAGFRPAMVLITACKLGVFDLLDRSPQFGLEVAERCSISARGAERLLQACGALGLVETEGGRYRNTPLSATYLVRGRERYAGDFVALSADSLESWFHLEEALRSGRPLKPTSWEKVLEMEPDEVDRYVYGLFQRGRFDDWVSRDEVDLVGARRLLDVAGGSGIYSMLLAQRYPHLQCTVFDLPPVVERAQALIQSHGLEGRVVTRAGNYLLEGLGTDYDAVLLSNCLQTEGRTICQSLLRKAHQALDTGGVLVIYGIMCDADRMSPPAAALFSLMMFLRFPDGAAHTIEEIVAWTMQAGFTQVDRKRLPPPAMHTLVTARKG